jgi:hypothetical protein
MPEDQPTAVPLILSQYLSYLTRKYKITAFKIQYLKLRDMLRVNQQDHSINIF